MIKLSSNDYNTLLLNSPKSQCGTKARTENISLKLALSFMI